MQVRNNLRIVAVAESTLILSYLETCQFALDVGCISKSRLCGRSSRHEGALLALLRLIKTTGVVERLRVVIDELTRVFF